MRQGWLRCAKIVSSEASAYSSQPPRIDAPKPMLLGTYGHRKLVKQGQKIGIVHLVEHDEAGIHRLITALARQQRSGMAPKPRCRLVQHDGMILGQHMRCGHARYPAPDDSNAACGGRGFEWHVSVLDRFRVYASCVNLDQYFSTAVDPIGGTSRTPCMISQAHQTPVSHGRAPPVLYVRGYDVRNMGAAGVTTEQQDWSALMMQVRDQRDRLAFGALFGHFAPRVKHFLMKGGAPAAVAEDCAQDVMATVWAKAAQFDPTRASVATWIFTIARNRRIDMARRDRRPEPEELDWMGEDEPDQADVYAAAEETTVAECGPGRTARKATRADPAGLLRRPVPQRDRCRDRVAAWTPSSRGSGSPWTSCV